MFNNKNKTDFIPPAKVLIEDFYPSNVVGGLNRCKVLISNVKNQEKPYIGLIIPADSTSPINYESETWNIIRKALIMMQLKNDDVEFYLDHKESKLISGDGFMKAMYKLKPNGDFIDVSYSKNLREVEIPLYVKEVRDQYYKPTHLKA